MFMSSSPFTVHDPLHLFQRALENYRLGLTGKSLVFLFCKEEMEAQKPELTCSWAEDWMLATRPAPGAS